MMMLDKELKACGYAGDPEAFREIVADLFVEMYRSWSDEDLLHHPTEALDFCKVVRRRAGNYDLPDTLILRTLTNLRKKNGQIAVRPSKSNGRNKPR